jgi:glutaryl-CoA dehydrogenase
MAAADGRMEKIGCFDLTGPLVGSGARRMLTTAKRGDSWAQWPEAMDRQCPWCDISIIWARFVADNQVVASLSRTKTTPGFSVEKIETRSRSRWSRTARSR